MKKAIKMTYFEASFQGLFRKQNQRNTGLFNYHVIKWDYLFIINPIKIEHQEIEQLKAGDYWYKEEIKDKKWYRFKSKTAEIIISKEDKKSNTGDIHHYQGDLHQVVMRDFETDISTGLTKLKKVSQDHYEVSGTIYFGIPEKLPKQPDAQENSLKNLFARTIGNGLNIFVTTNQASGQSKATSTEPSIPKISIPPTKPSEPPQSKGRGCGSKLLGVFAFIYWIAALIALWRTLPWLFWAFLIASVLWYISRLLGKTTLSRIFGILIAGCIVYYWSGIYKNVKQQRKAEDKGKGNVKVLPPREDTENKNSNEKDYLTEKQIHWWDFIKNNYNISYNTSSLAFLDIQKHNAGVGQFQGRNEIDIYTQIYNHMVKYDSKYIDSVVLKLKQLAAEKKLTQIQQAEMVTTMIQEIPYCLVHDLSCRQAIQQNGGFIKEYHQKGGDCLPNIPAGLQSPYQFLHNLKGDCDTRSVLAHLLLTRLGIGSSVWISAEYGHSILGVALPVGSGSYKNIQGVNHYAVEMTAEGFRLGMIAPEHRNMNNWNITLYKQ